MMQLTLARWQPVRRGLVAAGRAAASGPALHVGSLALALAISAVALRTLTAPAGPVEQPVVAEDGAPVAPADARGVRQPAPSPEPVASRPRLAPTYYLVGSEADAAVVAEVIGKGVRTAHAQESLLGEDFQDAQVIVIAGGEVWFHMESAINTERRAVGLPDMSVVDLRAR